MASRPEPALIQRPPGARARFERSLPLILLGVGICAVFGPPGAWLRLGALAGVYVLGTLAITRLADALGRPALDTLLTNVVNAAVVVAGLVLVGELHGPLVGLIVLCVLSATLLGGPRMGAATAVAALACYATALGLSAGGLIPSYPPVLSGEWPAVAAGVFAAFTFAGGVLMSDMLGGRTLEAVQHQHAAALEAQVSERTAELQRANERLRAMQRQLMESERLEYAEALGGRVAHVLNNPLTALIGSLQLLVDQDAPADPLAERSLQLARRLEVLVERTLAYTRGGTLELSAVDAGALLTDVRDQLAERAARQDVKLALRVQSALPPVHADAALLETGLVCVAENALDAMPDGGRLDLEALSIERPRLVEFRLSDTGPGIPPELHDEVFEPFFSTKSRGTGLGLSIARGIVLGHQGRLSLDKGPRGGARVSLQIPAVQVPAP